MFENVMAWKKGKIMSVCKGRFDYIKRGIVGVCAATLLTGIVAAPAFAAVEVSGSTSQEVSTPVTIDAKDLQVSVTVPTGVPVALNGDTVTLPTDLKIEATGKAAVKVTNIQAKNAVSSLVFASAKTDLAANNVYFSVAGNAVTDTAVAPITAIPIGSALSLDADFGQLSGTVLDAMVKGTTAAPAKLFDLTWTIGLDTTTV